MTKEGLLQKIENIPRSGNKGWLIDRKRTIKAVKKTKAEFKKRPVKLWETQEIINLLDSEEAKG